MNALHDILQQHVDRGTVPGAVALVARGDDVEVVTVGSVDTDGTAPMARDSIFRIASLTKPITAAAVLMLVEDGVLTLDAPVEEWLPELAKPLVVRTPEAPVEDVVPASRPITVEDLLSSRTGWGLSENFSVPAMQALLSVQRHDRPFHEWPDPDTWLGLLAQVPMLHQPGEAWLYGTSSALQGILIARASGRTLPDFLAERIFEPLGMKDTAFEVPSSKRHRFTSSYAPAADGTLHLTDTPDGDWSSVPRFPSGGGALVSTADDWLAFARLLLNAGTAPDGHRLLSATSVSRMTTNHLTAEQRSAVTLFLDGQGWGYGGQVDVTPADPWNVPGRYGWIGGTGTTAHITPPTGTVAILMTQAGITSPSSTPVMQDFWRCVAGG
ncbi:serine hydrolase [Streptomyces coacervatus]|uniref:Serine hydrolase n=1 Tax=Streptomyces coacervatus TaxID=647381 RepID=A0ABP7INA7_9ACTN|nr:serine hydrolase domain-containing protein [Streptomyces coacervatus]MDF2268697.1 serine hydrolase [Streptomyces coacervatus]